MYFALLIAIQIFFCFFMAILSSHGGLVVDQWTDNRTLSLSLGSNPSWRQKDFRSNSNTTGGALVNNVQKLMRLSLLD